MRLVSTVGDESGSTNYTVCVCVNLKQDHTVQRRSCGRVPGGARLHDYWQQASKRGAAKEVRFPGFCPDGDGERRADHCGERDEAQVVRDKKEVVAVRDVRVN